MTSQLTTAIARRIETWFRAALEAVDPGAAVRSHLTCGDGVLRVGGRSVELRGALFVAAVGKAAPAMVYGAIAVCGDAIDRGFVLTKDGHLRGAVPANFTAFEAAHPIPDARGVAATEQLLNIVRALGPDDVVLTLISGGGSALLESPLEELSTRDVSTTTELLLKAGAPIQDLNAVRVPLSRVKGGGLRRAGARARFVTLLLSDVLSDDPRVIASGPTVPSDFTGAHALAVLDQYGVTAKVPERVRAALHGASGDAELSLFDSDIVEIVASNRIALDAFRVAAERDGQRVLVVQQPAEGEARTVAAEMVADCVAMTNDVDIALRGAETTVTVRGSGDGGRNTEFVLAALLELERRGNRDWMVASLATDGQDALTGMAGAIGSVSTLERARAAGVDPARCLRENDSLAVFRAGGGVVETGPTGTNVNDVIVFARSTG